MRKFFSSLRVQLLLIVFFAALPALGIIIYSGWEQKKLAQETTKKEILYKVSIIASFQKRVFEEAHVEMAILANLPDLQDPKTGTCLAVLHKFIKNNSEYENLGVADREGRVICSALPMEKEISLADRPYFQASLKTGKFSVGTYQIGRISGRVSVGTGYPVSDIHGKITRVIFAGLDLAWLQKFLAEGTRGVFDNEVIVTVIDRQGTVLARWPGGEQWVGIQKPETDIIETVLARGNGTTEAYGLDGVHKVYAFLPLDPTYQVGFVYAGIPTTISYAKINRELTRNLIFMGLALSLALGIAWFLSSHLVLSRLNPLLIAARHIAAGDLSARTGLAYGKGEIDQLARNFDVMGEELQKRAEELHFINDILIIANQGDSIDQLLKEFVTTIQNYTRCTATGIRVLGEDGHISYQFYEGFSRECYELESPVAIKNDACLCSNVIKDETDPQLPFFTKGGSSFSNHKTEFLVSVPKGEKGKTRNVFNEFGYKSLALVPVRVGSQILGLIHVADEREDMVPLGLVEVLEKVGMRLGQALKRQQDEKHIHALSHELIRAQEEEKKKISRELHDSVAQELAALKITLEHLSVDLPGKPLEEIIPRISELSQALQRTLGSIRNLSSDLRPPDLENLGLMEAIRLHCEDVAARTRLAINVTDAGMEGLHLSDEVAINLFRIVQEGVTNVWRHARAANMDIKMVASFPFIILRLEDNGRGFDILGYESSLAVEKHLGLLGMKERVALLGGKMSIESRLQKGTKITIEIPWKGEDLEAQEENHHS